MPDSHIPCPVEGCNSDTNTIERDAAHERPLILESTRSHAGEDAWRDMDGFDPNEELARLRRAVHEVQTHYLARPRQRFTAWVLNRLGHTPENVERMLDLLAFVSETFANLDDTLVRLGPLPRAWSSHDQRVANSWGNHARRIAEDLADQFAESLPDVGPDYPDEYRRGQKRAYLDAAVLIRRAFGLQPDPRIPFPHA